MRKDRHPHSWKVTLILTTLFFFNFVFPAVPSAKNIYIPRESGNASDNLLDFMPAFLSKMSISGYSIKTEDAEAFLYPVKGQNDTYFMSTSEGEMILVRITNDKHVVATYYNRHGQYLSIESSADGVPHIAYADDKIFFFGNFQGSFFNAGAFDDISATATSKKYISLDIDTKNKLDTFQSLHSSYFQAREKLDCLNDFSPEAKKRVAIESMRLGTYLVSGASCAFGLAAISTGVGSPFGIALASSGCVTLALSTINWAFQNEAAVADQTISAINCAVPALGSLISCGQFLVTAEADLMEARQRILEGSQSNEVAALEQTTGEKRFTVSIQNLCMMDPTLLRQYGTVFASSIVDTDPDNARHNKKMFARMFDDNDNQVNQPEQWFSGKDGPNSIYFFDSKNEPALIPPIFIAIEIEDSSTGYREVAFSEKIRTSIPSCTFGVDSTGGSKYSKDFKASFTVNPCVTPKIGDDYTRIRAVGTVQAFCNDNGYLNWNYIATEFLVTSFSQSASCDEPFVGETNFSGGCQGTLTAYPIVDFYLKDYAGNKYRCGSPAGVDLQ